MRTHASHPDAERVLQLRYPVTIVSVSAEEGGGYRASIPQLGARAFVAAGDTPEEALRALDDVRRYLIPQLLSEGYVFPEPEDDLASLKDYSGNVILRLPKALHRSLAQAAVESGTSINKLATQLLSAGLERVSLTKEMDHLAERIAEQIAAKLAPKARPSEYSRHLGPWEAEPALVVEEDEPVMPADGGSYSIAA